MENKKQAFGSSSSSSTSLDHLFGPKESSSSSTTGLFGSIFPPPPAVAERERKFQNQGGGGKYANPAESSYFSSSIYYGGQENYSPRTKPTESHHTVSDLTVPRKKRKKRIHTEEIQTVLQEEIGGRVHCITSQNCPIYVRSFTHKGCNCGARFGKMKKLCQ